MKATRTKQLALGVLTGLLMVCLGVLVAHWSGLGTANGTASADPNALGAPLSPVQTGVSGGFSALDNAALKGAPSSVIEDFKSMHDGPYADAKALGDGMYLATNNGALCAWVVGGFGQCTEKLNYDDVWLEGTERRAYDSATAPFDAELYGFARDAISSVEITTTKGERYSVPVVNNAFRVTLKDTSFADLASVEKAYVSGEKVIMDTKDQFRSPVGAATP